MPAPEVCQLRSPAESWIWRQPLQKLAALAPAPPDRGSAWAGLLHLQCQGSADSRQPAKRFQDLPRGGRRFKFRDPGIGIRPLLRSLDPVGHSIRAARVVGYHQPMLSGATGEEQALARRAAGDQHAVLVPEEVASAGARLGDEGDLLELGGGVAPQAV